MTCLNNEGTVPTAHSSPEELDRIACDPGRKVYLDAIIECRRCRIKTIDGLLAMLEAKE